MKTSIRISSHRRLCRRGLVAVLPLSLIILAATAANVPDFLDLKGSFKGKATLFAGGLSAPGKATASLAAKKQGKEGKLKISGTYSANGTTLTAKREINFKGRKIKTRTQLLTGFGNGSGRGTGKFRFKNSKFSYEDSFTLTANGTPVPLAVKGTARFTPRKASISEVWTSSSTSTVLTFKLNLKRK